MRTLSNIFKQYPLTIFFAIAYATSFIGGYLAEAYPSDWWALFVYGPFIGGLVVTALADGRRGLKAWFGRIVRWRVGVQWYLVAFLLPIAIQLVALGVNLLMGAPMPAAAQWGTWPDYLMEFVFIFLFIGLAEEPGFRGFALHRLLKQYSAVVATLIIWVLHTIWHLPLLLNGSESLLLVPIIFAGSFVFTWIYRGTGASVLLVMIFHAMVNTSQGYFGNLLDGAAQERQRTLMLAVYLVVVVMIVVKNWSGFFRRPEIEGGSIAPDSQLATH